MSTGNPPAGVDEDAVASALTAFVNANIMARGRSVQPDDEFELMGIDSMAMLKVLLFIEAEFGFWMPDADLVAVVENARWLDGPLSSLQVGLRAIADASWTGVLVLTVDRPHVRATTIAALLREHASHPDAVLQPMHAGRRGHPILHPRDVAEALLQLPPTASARDVVHRPDIAARRLAIDVDDAAILDNIDTPEALARLLGSG